MPLTDLDAKRAELRLRAKNLSEQGVNLTQWLEVELAKAEDELELAAIDVELTTREREQGKSTNARWIVGIIWVFVIAVIIVHAISR